MKKTRTNFYKEIYGDNERTARQGGDMFFDGVVIVLSGLAIIAFVILLIVNIK